MMTRADLECRYGYSVQIKIIETSDKTKIKPKVG